MQDILIILVCIGLGMGLGYMQRSNRFMLELADRASRYAVFALLFFLGTKLGGDAGLMSHLPAIGAKALGISTCCTAGSVFAFLLVRSMLPGPAVLSSKGTGPGPSPITGSLRILSFFIVGVVFSGLELIPSWVSGGSIATYALFFLVFTVGIGLGADLRAFRVIRDMHIKILLIPLLVILGTAGGALFASAIFPGISLKDALCVGAGFGYYSLSSFLIESAGNSVLASVALLANILREIMAILTVPLIARYFGRLAPIGAAGATAMDTCLPVIARFSGERAAVIAVFSGMTLTLLVPILVMAVLQLF